jgi:hypothetical protein
VPVRDVNDDEIIDLTTFSIEHGYRMRFIESMPLDAQQAWDRDRIISAEEILNRLAERFDSNSLGRQDNSPAEEWRIVGTDAVVGVIASVTRAFCGSCDRVRLTADGQLRNCLFATEESNLRALLRGGADGAAIEHPWRVSIAGKGPRPYHQQHGVQPPRTPHVRHWRLRPQPEDRNMNPLEQWLADAKAELGIDLDVDVAELLDMTKVVAHKVARPAAPLTAFLVGYAAAQAGGGPAAVVEASRKVATLAESRGEPGPAIE